MDINYITAEPEIEEETAAPPEPPRVSRPVPAPPVSSVLRVGLENITPLWPQAQPLVVRALRGTGTHDDEDVRRLLLGGCAQLWAQYAGQLDAMLISEFVNYPKGVWLRIWLAAARADVRMDDLAFYEALTAWRDQHKCRGFEIIGRLGWLRRLPDARFIGAIMRSGE